MALDGSLGTAEADGERGSVLRAGAQGSGSGKSPLQDRRRKTDAPRGRSPEGPATAHEPVIVV